MSIICSPTPLPSYSSISAMVRSLMPATPIDFPGINLTSPTMPTMPSIPWPSMQSINASLEMFINQLQAYQIFAVVGVVYDRLAQYFSLPFPSIPGLPSLSFPNIMAMNPQALVDTLKVAAGNSLNFSFLPHVPNPIFPRFGMPDMEILSALQLTTAAYMSNLTNLLFTMANQVADIFDVSSMAALPAFPSLSSILAMMPSIPTLEDLKALVFGPFGNFSLAGILPDPLIPGFSIPDLEFIQGLKTLYASLSSYSLELIVNFVQNTLNLSLNLPTICLPLSFTS